MALGLTQEELGELLGRNRRTIQRWQDNDFEPMADQAEMLARALQPVRPDLAEQVPDVGPGLEGDGASTARARPAAPPTGWWSRPRCSASENGRCDAERHLP